MTMYGYARVSSKDQNLNRQLDALSAVGVSEESVFVDYLSGATSIAPDINRWSNVCSLATCSW